MNTPTPGLASETGSEREAEWKRIRIMMRNHFMREIWLLITSGLIMIVVSPWAGWRIGVMGLFLLTVSVVAYRMNRKWLNE